MKKQKMAKKMIALVMTACVVLTGCSLGKSEQASSDTYEIVWYTEGDNTKDKDLVNKEINEYLKEKIGATVKIIHFSAADYAEKMKLLLASGEVFDMCAVPSNTYGQNAENGAFLPIDKLLETNGKDILKLMPEEMWDAVKYRGEIYAVPTIKDWATQYVIGCNKQITDKYNIDLSNVKSLADMEDILADIKEKEPKMYPTDLRGNDYIKRLLPFEYISDSVLGAFEKDGDYTKVVNWIETDTAKEFFDMMHRWYKKGYLRPDADTATTSSDITFFMNCTEMIPYQEQQYNAARTPDKQRYFVNVGDSIVTTNYVQAALQAISRTSKNPEKTMEFLNMFYTDKHLLNLYVYGIEGKHYTLEDDGMTVKYPDGVMNFTENDYYATAAGQGNRFLLNIPPNTPTDIWDAYQKFNKESFISPALGFVFDISELSAEIAAMNNVYKEYMPALTTGVSNPETELPKAIKKFKAAGSDKVFKELQRQYDEWRKTNKK